MLTLRRCSLFEARFDVFGVAEEGSRIGAAIARSLCRHHHQSRIRHILPSRVGSLLSQDMREYMNKRVQPFRLLVQLLNH